MISKYFLLIDGLNGGSTAAGHEGWFEISGFDFDIDTVLAAGTGSGAGTGKATFSPVTVQLSLSDGLAGVLKDAALGTHVQSVKIEGVTGGANPAAVYDLSLGNVQITSAHDSSGPNDSLTFTYGQVALTTKVQNPDGSVAPGESFSYDVAAARLDADVPEPSAGASIGEVPTPAKYFLLIDGLNGGSTAAGHEGWFEISGFDFDIDTVLAAGTGSGAGTGKATFSPVTVQLSLSDGLAGVLKDAALGTHVQSVKIEGVTGGANPAAVYDLSLGNVQITSAHDSSGPNDSLTFTYGQVALTTKVQNPDGSVAPGESFSYDVAAARLDADVPEPSAGASIGEVPTPAKYFLLIDGLNGGSTAAGHEGWFEISGFDFDIDTVLAAGTGSGAGTGKATFSPVTVQLSLSDGLAGVLKDAALGTHVQSVKIEGVTGGANPAAVYDLSLGNVQITSAHDSSGPNDSLTFTYGQVALTTKVQNPDGSVAPGESFGYDVARNQVIDPGTLSPPSPAGAAPVSAADGPYAAIEDMTLIVNTAEGVLANDSLLAAGGTLPASAVASKYFLLIDGLNGGSTAAGHEGWFEISGFDFDIDTVLAAGTGSGAGTGKATFSPMTVQLSLSDGLAGVLKDAALGTHVQSVKIEGVTGGANPAAVYDLSLGNVQITSAHDSSGPNDSLTFTYGQVALTTKVQNPDGSLAPGESFSYDVAAARLDADVPEPSAGASIGEVPTPAKYFLLIDGLNGGSTAAGHEGWFEISGFDFDIDTVLAAGTGSGAGTGKATFSPVTVQLSLSDGLAGVLKDAALGTHVQSVKIEGVTGGANPAAVYDLSLGNVQITSAHDSSGPNDSLTFTYGQVALTTKVQNPDGSLAPGESFSYDVAAARLDADVPEPSAGASIGEVPTPAKYFLLIDGLNGGSTAAGHEGWFEISGFDFDIDTVLAAGTGSGAGTGKATFSPVTVQLSLSDGLAGVLKDAALGTHVQSVKIEGVTGGANPAAVYDLSLGNVQITSAHDSSGPNDSLTFTYGQVALTTKVQNPDGSVAPGESFGYDVARNQVIDPGTLSPPSPAGAAPVSAADGPYAAIEDMTLIVNTAEGVLANDSLLAAGGTLPASAVASKYFLLIDGLNGGSTAAGHEGWFEISGFDFDIDTVLAAGTGSGAGTGKATFSPVTVQLSLSDGLAGVLKDAALGTHVQSVKIEGVTGGANPAAVYDLSLGNVQITSAHDSSGPNDSLTFTYGQVALTTKVQNPDGSVAPGESFSYDVAAARLDADVPEPSAGASIGEVPTPAKYFLLIDGLNGGSTAAGHEGWFEISGFDFDIDTVLAAGTGSGAGTGKATFSPVTVQLSLSDGLAGVLKDAALGTHVQSVKIEGVTGGANPAAVYDLSLGNVQITSAHDSSGPNDSLTFTYGQVALTTKVQNPDGSVAPGESFSYDVAAARLDADVPEPSAGASIGEVPTPAKYFLLIDGLNGGSTAAGHEGWFEISGFDFDIDTVLAAGTGSGAGTGKATFSPVTVQLSLSDGLAGVLKDAALGTHVQSVKIEGVTGGANPAAVYDLSLGNVQITSAHDSSGPNDSLTFTYGQVALTTKVQNPDGSVAPGESFSYDVAAARLDADVPEPSAGASIGEVPTPAKYFLLIDGLNGGSTAAGHEGWFEISGFDFDIDTVLAAGTGSGAGTGKATFSPVTVQLSLSDGLAGVLKDAALGTHVQSVKIEGVTGGANPAAVYDLSLGNVQITSAHDSSGPNDSLTFTYGQVALTTKVQNPDGSVAPGESFSYDVAAARLDADVPEPSAGASIGEVPTPAKYFLLIDGLNGGSTAAGHEGWFEISGFDFDIDTVLAAGTGSGAGTGKATFSPVTVQLSLSDGLAGVLKDAALGTHVQSVKIEGVTGGANPAAVYDLSLGNVQITSAHDSSGPNDSLTFTYGQVALTTKVQNPDGSVAPGESFSYDVAAARLDADVPEPSAGASIGEVPTPAKYFLLIDGLNGGSTAAGHEGWFEISGFDFDIDTVLAAGTGSGAGTGKATFSPVTVQLSLDPDLAGALRDAATGHNIAAIKLEGVTGQGQAVYDLTLADVVVTQLHEGNGGNDSLSFDYQKLGLITRVQHADGSTAPGGSFGYDVARNQIIDPPTLPTPSPNGVHGNVLTSELVSTTTYGALTLNPDGSFIYTPDANFNGTDSFVYHANDGSRDFERRHGFDQRGTRERCAGDYVGSEHCGGRK